MAVFRNPLQRRLQHTAAHPHKINPLPAFVFDIDGVLRAGKRILPEGKEALQILDGNNKWRRKFPYILCTNGGGESESTRARRLSDELGVQITADRLILSHTPMRRYVKDFGHLPVLIVGGKGYNCRDVAREYGFREVWTTTDILARHPDVWPFERPPRDVDVSALPDFNNVSFGAILVFHDSLSWGRDAQIICDIARGRSGVLDKPRDRRKSSDWGQARQIPVHWSNPDLIFKGGFHLPRFGQGAFQEAVKAIYKSVTGHTLHSFTHGKPSESTYAYATSTLQSLVGPKQQIIAKHIYMIGDNPESDIAGGNRAGWNTALVKTGVFEEKDGPPKHQPTFISENVLEAVNRALTMELD